MSPRLPPGRTHFHGRESERSELVALLRAREARLVTLQGAPGTGKTRLALEVARELEGAFEVWPCDLSAARNTADATLALADALEQELPERADVKAAAAALTRALGTAGDKLLLLDHLEHLLPDVRPLLEACLDAGPHVHVLATSRERLDVEGERCLPLPPLPDDDAVALFLDRARAAGAVLGDEALPVVRELVGRLDGVPLALELAAARARVLSPKRLLERLEERLSVLGGAGARADLPTLDEAIRLSWDRLSVVEQRALARASLFAGAFSLESAEAVLHDDESDEEEPAEVLDVLQGLVDRSLLTSVPARDGEVRFRLLENVRAFAAARARELGLVEKTRERHACWLAAESERRLVHPRVSQPPAALAWLQSERDELLAVVRQPPSSPNGTRAAVVCALALHRLSRDRGPAEVHHEVLARAEGLAAALSDDDAELALRVDAACVITRRDEQDWRAAVDALERLAARARDLGARDLEADAERVAGELLFLQGQHDAAITRLEAAVARYDAAGAREGAALSKTLLGPALQSAGRALDAERVLVEAVTAADQGDLSRVAARAQYRLGILAHQRGALEDASARYELALERLGPKSGDLMLEAGVKHKLAALHHERGELDAALALYEEALGLYETVGASWYCGATLAMVGAVKADLGDVDEAVRLARKGEALLTASGPPASGFAAAWLGAIECRGGERAAAEASFARAHEALDERGDAFDRALLAVLEGHLQVLADPASRDDVLAAAREKAALGATPRFGLRFLERSLLDETRAKVRRASGPRSLVVAADARWFAPPAGARVDVAKKRVLRRLLAALVERRLEAPGTALSRAELLEAGWPGERMRPDSALSRLYVSVASLRRLGLEDVLLTAGDGYLLDPELEIALERAAPAGA